MTRSYPSITMEAKASVPATIALGPVSSIAAEI
jgi:hypothetical protein